MAVHGRFTDCDLGNVIPLSMPWQENDGILRPDYSQSAMKLSLELAAAAYDLEIAPWREAGWYDFSYQVDNTLLTGYVVNGGGKSDSISNYFRNLAHSRIRRQNPISQIRGALRQREAGDTCKALIMMHKAPGNGYILAIGFMGTGRRIFDWISNLRLEEEEGVHKGFLQLTHEFEENIEKIQFPRTAKELGREQLTLADILNRCRKPGSPFRIWIAGHSQGGAIMQLMALREIRKGLLRQNLIGYGFASPSVIYENPGVDLAGFPLFHVINGDDITPRLGAALHVGQCMVYFPDDAMREMCYGAAWQNMAFRQILRENAEIRDNRMAMIWIKAFCEALHDLPDDQSVAILSGMLGKMMPERLIALLGGKMDDLLGYCSRRAEQSYVLATGEKKMPDGFAEMYRFRIRHTIDTLGARNFVKILLQTFVFPHKLRGNVTEGKMASYQYIVNYRFHLLHKRIWCYPAPFGSSFQYGKRYVVKKSRYARFSSLKKIDCTVK